MKKSKINRVKESPTNQGFMQSLGLISWPKKLYKTKLVLLGLRRKSMGHLFDSFGLRKKAQEKLDLMVPRLGFRAFSCFKAYLIWAWSWAWPKTSRSP